MRRGLRSKIRDHYKGRILEALEVQVVGVSSLVVLGLLRSDAPHAHRQCPLFCVGPQRGQGRVESKSHHGVS